VTKFDLVGGPAPTATPTATPSPTPTTAPSATPTVTQTPPSVGFRLYLPLVVK
jgi:hypothetical protein